MPSYSGGKFYTSKDIYKAIKEQVKNKEVRGYIEPFCGGLNVIREFVDEYECYAYDNNKDLIFLWNHIKENDFDIMPVISKEYFDELKKSNELSVDKSFAMLFCVYNCIQYRGYVNNHYVNKKTTKISRTHNIRYNGIKKVEQHIKKINFKCQDYKHTTEQVQDGGFIIYCDPPYTDTTQAYSTKKFNAEEFWNTVLLWKYLGNYIFVSEKVCPVDNTCIFEKNINISMTRGDKKMTDKLFMI